ncbi:MAG: serine-type D-Ala-D-Ala carboxypeptidase, partial [Pseudomonadales bacterium]
KLLTYGFRFFETAQLYDAGEPVKKLRLWGGVENAISVGLPNDVALTLAKGTQDKLQAEVATPREIHAPIAAGQALGRLTITLPNGREVVHQLVALQSVQEAGFFARLWDGIALFFLNLFGGDPFAVGD